jgi:hypothetical protein
MALEHDSSNGSAEPDIAEWAWNSRPEPEDGIERIGQREAVCLALADLGWQAPVAKVQDYLRDVGIDVAESTIEAIKESLERESGARP